MDTRSYFALLQKTKIKLTQNLSILSDNMIEDTGAWIQLEPTMSGCLREKLLFTLNGKLCNLDLRVFQPKCGCLCVCVPPQTPGKLIPATAANNYSSCVDSPRGTRAEVLLQNRLVFCRTLLPVPVPTLLREGQTWTRRQSWKTGYCIRENQNILVWLSNQGYMNSTATHTQGLSSRGFKIRTSILNSVE